MWSLAFVLFIWSSFSPRRLPRSVRLLVRLAMLLETVFTKVTATELAVVSTSSTEDGGVVVDVVVVVVDISVKVRGRNIRSSQVNCQMDTMFVF